MILFCSFSRNRFLRHLLNGRGREDGAKCLTEQPVARYFFHVCNGEQIEDKRGMELASLQAARIEAIQRIGRFITAHPDLCCTTHDWRMEVADPQGLLMFRLDLDLTLVESPSTGR